MSNTDLSSGTLKLIRICFLIVGVVMILTSFLYGTIAESTHHANWNRIVVGALGVVLTNAGIAIGAKNNYFNRISTFLLGTIVAFLLIELCGAAGLFIINRLTPEPEVDPKEAELLINSGTYRPFVLWRASPDSRNPSVTIQSTGLRVVPGSSTDSSAIKVFVFGGSTVVGWGVPDSATICAQIQKGLALRYNDPVCVTNFGQQGYVNTQQLIELQLQLRAGNIPDLVIFYDGTNEVWSAVESDTAGVHFSLQEISDLYENRNFTRERSSLSQYGFLDLASELNSIRLLKTIMGEDLTVSRLSLYEAEPSRCMLEGEDYVTPSAFAREIVDIYEGDLRILKALSEEFGFEYRVFWQPVLLTGNKRMTQEEQIIYDSQSSFLLQLYKECELLAKALEQEYDNYYCITDVFNDVQQTVYQDYCHLNAFGDSLIAVRILHDLPDLRTR
jgi:hypothetical protein